MVEPHVGELCFLPPSFGDGVYDAAPDFQVDTFSPNLMAMDMTGFGQFDGAVPGQSFHDPRLQFDFDGMALNGPALGDFACINRGVGRDHGSELTSPVSPVSPLSALIISPMEKASDDFPDMQSLSVNAHAHAGPWTPVVSRSNPYISSGHLQITGRVGQPRHEFMQSTYSRSFGGFSFADSGYVSTAPADTVSLVSAPSAMMFAPDDASDIMEPPTKKIRKPFRCAEAGAHRTRDFANIHDLERHQRCAHGMQPVHSDPFYYKCCVQDCKSRTRPWERKDNFRNHLVRRHFDGDASPKNEINELVERSKCILTPSQVQDWNNTKQAAKQESRRAAQRRRAKRSPRVRSNERLKTKPVSSAASVAEDADYVFDYGPTGLLDVYMTHRDDEPTTMGGPAFVPAQQNVSTPPVMSTEHDMW